MIIGRRLRRTGSALGITLLLATTGVHRAKADGIVAVYAAFWAGLPAGWIRLSLSDGETQYHDEIEIRTEGLPGLVTRFRGTAQAEGRFAPGRSAEPSRYDAAYDLRKWRDSHVSMRFVARGSATVAERGIGDTSHKPPLAEIFRRDAVDPMTALERIREALRAALHGGTETFAVAVYDGTRRFDVVGHILPKADGSDRALRVALSLHPIAGFKGSANGSGDRDNAPRPAELMVSDDTRLLPLSIRLSVFYLPLIVRLDHLCMPAGPCGG